MKEMKVSASIEKFVDGLGEILAFFTVLLVVFVSLNNAFTFITNINVVNTLESVKEIAILVVLALKGMEFAIKRGFIIFVIYAALVAFAIIMLFFPGVLPINPKV